MLWTWLSQMASSARTGLDIHATVASLAGVVIGFALARVSDWSRSRPNIAVYHLRTRSLYAFFGVAMSRQEWCQCRKDNEWSATALVVVTVMVHNKCTNDDAVMQVRLLLGRGSDYTPTAKESAVQDFLPTPVKAHGVAPLRFVFELPREQVGGELWNRLETAAVTLELATIRGQRKRVPLDLADSFIQQQIPDPTTGHGEPPPIRGYTDVRIASGVRATETYFGQRRVFDDHELW